MKLTRTFEIEDSLLDSLGHVNYLAHQQLVNRVHAEMLEMLGAGVKTLLSQGHMLVMRQIEVRYVRPIKPGETARVALSAYRRGHASAVFHATVSVGEQIATSIRYTMVSCSAESQKIEPLPAPFAALPQAAKALQ